MINIKTALINFGALVCIGMMGYVIMMDGNPKVIVFPMIGLTMYVTHHMKG